jgi:hypothetical protein
MAEYPMAGYQLPNRSNGPDFVVAVDSAWVRDTGAAFLKPSAEQHLFELPRVDPFVDSRPGCGRKELLFGRLPCVALFQPVGETLVSTSKQASQTGGKRIN